MYMDDKLIFARAADAAVTETPAVSLLQGDYNGWPGLTPPNTAGAGPYQGLYLVVKAGEPVAAADNLVVTLQHDDARTGAFSDLLTLPAVGADVEAGELIAAVAVPQHSKNWLRLSLSAAKQLDAFLTVAVDRHVPGVWDGSAN